MTVQRRILGRTNLSVSSVAFGAGPVSGLMTGEDADKQWHVVSAAIDVGINWFDTAPGYGKGRSESNLGAILSQHPSRNALHLATKVRIPAELTESVSDYVRRSVEASLKRLQVDHVSLLQLHNGITHRAQEEPDSLSVEQLVSPEGVLDALERVKEEGLVRFIGMTGTGHCEAVRSVIRTGRMDAIQIPYNLLNPSAGATVTFPDDRVNYGHLIADCADERMGVFAIRVFAGGAVFDRPPSPHTLVTRYFPLELYEKDRERTNEIRNTLGPRERLAAQAVTFALSHSSITAAILGFASAEEVQEATSRSCPPGTT